MAEINYYADHIIRGTLSTTGIIFVGGTLTVQSGNINLGSGTGRIQGVDTVSASTDAANKAYVDAHPAGTVTGGGVASRVAFWSGTSSLSSDVNLYWDGTNDRLGVGTSTPLVPLHVVGTLRAGAAADYVELTTSGNVVFSDGTSAILPTTSGTQTLSIGAGLGAPSWNTISHQFSNEAVWNPGILGAMDAMNLSSTGDLLIKGDVGIGLTNPTCTLQVAKAASGPVAKFDNTSGTGGTGLEVNGGNGTSFALSVGQYNGLERFRVQGNGNVGIGTSSPATQLEIYKINDDPATLRLSSEVQDGDAVAAIISFSNDAGGGGVQGRIENIATEDDSTVFKFYNDNSSTPTMTLNDNGNLTLAGAATATNFILSSDKTLKAKIKNIKASHVDIKWKNFELISEPGVKRSGVIAQELEEKHPEFIRTDKDGLKSVAYIDLLITKIAELEARLEKAGL